MNAKDKTSRYSAATLDIAGMHCESCVGRVETALLRLAGVAGVDVDLAEHRANISFDSEKASIDDLKASVGAEGYQVLHQKIKDLEPKEVYRSETFNWFSNPRSYLLGAIASFAIVGVYLGMNTLTADWYFAKIQFSEYRWWVIALAIGLGIQVSLFMLFRAHLRGQKMGTAKSTMAASGGMSATAMMACCSHYLATVIPALGVPFLSAAAVASIAEYQAYFFLAGILSCLIGIGLMLRMMNKHNMILFGNLKSILSLKLNRIRG